MKKISQKPPYIPVFINLRKRKCIVVGGGAVAFRKVGMLLEGGASVKVISPDFCSDLRKLAGKNKIHLIGREYRPGDLRGSFLVIAATDRKSTNREIAAEAKRIKALVNVADDPDPSNFIVPSFFQRGDLIVAVSTGGASPALARRIRCILEENFGEEYALLAKIAGEVRTLLKDKDVKIDPETWQKALNPDQLIPLLKRGEVCRAKRILLERLTKNLPKT